MNTITWQVTAAATASFPLGWLTTHLSIWLAGSEETASGTLKILSGTAATTPATWTTSPSGWTVSVDNVAVQSGAALDSTLTVTDANGDAVDLTSAYSNIRYTFDPTGSSTKIAIPPTDTIINGSVTWQWFGVTDALAWSGATIELYAGTYPAGVLTDTTATGLTGGYSFAGVQAGDYYTLIPAGQKPAAYPAAPANNGNTYGAGTAVTGQTLTLDLAEGVGGT